MYRYFENNLPNRWVYVKNTILCVVITKANFFLQTEISCLALLGCEMTNIWARKRKKKGKKCGAFFPFRFSSSQWRRHAERSEASVHTING